MYRFFLRRDSATYYYYDGSTVQTDSNPRKLNFYPQGWQEISIRWSRDAFYHGVFRSVSTPLSFVNDGYKILEYLYETSGVEAVCECVIERQNDQNYNWELYYLGRVDFGTLKLQSFFALTNLIETGVELLIDQNEDIDYEIPVIFTDSNYQNVYLDGIRMQDVINYVPIVQATGINTQFDAPSIIISSADVTPDMDYPIAKTNNPNPTRVDWAFSPIDDASFLSYMYAALVDQTITIHYFQKIRISSAVANASGLNIEIVVVGTNKNVKSRTSIYSIPTGVLTSNYQNFDIDRTSSPINLIAGDRVYISYTATIHPSATYAIINFDIYGNSPTDLTYYHDFNATFRMPATHCGGFRYIDFLKKLVAKMTGDDLGTTYPLQSDFLSDPAKNSIDTYPFSEIVTCGDSLRGFADANIKTNFKDAFTDLNSTFAQGMGIENGVIRIEPLDHFYNKDTMIADLGAVTDLVIEPAIDWISNTFLVGYKDYDYDSINGRYEYNTNFLWTLPILSNKKQLTRLSPYRPDVLGVEQLRANLSQKKTTDSSSDNDTFILSCDPVNNAPDGSRKVYRPAGTITGVPFPDTYYNFGRSPKRSFWRNSTILSAICDLVDNTKSIIFQKTEKNKELNTNFGNGVIDEDANERLSLLASKLFRPVVYRFRAVPPINIPALMASNLYGYFQFSYSGKTYKGFATTVGCNLGTYGSFEFVLLATP